MWCIPACLGGSASIASAAVFLFRYSHPGSHWPSCWSPSRSCLTAPSCIARSTCYWRETKEFSLKTFCIRSPCILSPPPPNSFPCWGSLRFLASKLPNIQPQPQGCSPGKKALEKSPSTWMPATPPHPQLLKQERKKIEREHIRQRWVGREPTRSP